MIINQNSYNNSNRCGKIFFKANIRYETKHLMSKSGKRQVQ